MDRYIVNLTGNALGLFIVKEIEVTINSFEDKVITSIKDKFISVDEKYKSLYLIYLIKL